MAEAQQFYITGTTFSDSTSPLPFVKILLHSNKMLFNSGSKGDFGIPSSFKNDTVSCWAAGYDTTRQAVFQGRQNAIFLKAAGSTIAIENERGRLSNLIPNMEKEEEWYNPNNGETYPALIENKLVNVASFPVTGFSPHSNKASYANIRRFIQNKQVVNPNAVRVEDVINYFSLSCTSPPEPGEIFSVETRVTDCPWNPSGKMLFVNALAKAIDFEAVPPANLVFLIDNSGSMDTPNRMPLLKSAFTMLVRSLRPGDKVSIVTYGGVAGIYLPPTAGSEKEKIIKAIEGLECGGTTPGSGGIHLAYQLATTNPLPSGNNRVILATDGDFNVGVSGEKELEDLIVSYRKTGVSLTCLGVGMGNFKDSKIETLARFGNGNYAYLDNEQEAEKVMVQELTQNLYAVATDVTIHIQLDPYFLKQYRLIGYENRKGAVYHKKSMLVGGEIGSGFPINALFEIVLSDSSGGFITRNYNRPIGSLVFRYVDASKPNSGLQERVYPLRLNYVPLNETDRKIRFITAVAIYGSLLKKSEAFAGMTFSKVMELAKSSADPDDRQQSSFAGLVAETEKIYFPPEPPGKKKIAPFRKKHE